MVTTPGGVTTCWLSRQADLSRLRAHWFKTEAGVPFLSSSFSSFFFPLWAPWLLQRFMVVWARSVTSGVPDATVIGVAASLGVAFWSCPGSPSRLHVKPVNGSRLYYVMSVGSPSRSGCHGLKALAGYPFLLSLLFFPFPSSSALGRLPSGDPSMERPASSCGAVEQHLGGPGLRISLDCLSAGVATARFVPTLEEASALWGAILSRRLVPDLRCCYHYLGPPSSGAFEGGIRAMSVLELAAYLTDSGVEGKTVWHRRVWLPNLAVYPGSGVVLLVGPPTCAGLRWLCLRSSGCCSAACVASVVTQRVRAVAARLALDSLAVAFLVWRTLTGKSRCSMCRVASLVERCNTCLWLLSTWCWLVVNSSKAEVHRLVALCSSEVSLELFVVVLARNNALVVLVEVLPGPTCVASVVLLAVVFSLMVLLMTEWVADWSGVPDATVIRVTASLGVAFWSLPSSSSRLRVEPGQQVATALSLSRPRTAAEAGARLASRACGLRVPLLAARGGGLVSIVVAVFPMTFPSIIRCPSVHGGYSLAMPSSSGRRWSGLGQTCASGGFRLVSSRFHSSVLQCHSIVAPTCMASQPCGVPGVRGGSTCGTSNLCRSEVAVLAVRRRSHLVVAWSRQFLLLWPVRDWSS
ncbi:hypothetical protein Taro_000351, partial [Colocasia esculenta]|nr:hypothetical protein [Colocasia esculenta]